MAAAGVEFVELKRPVIERHRQPKAVLDERRLAGMVAGVHPAHLRHRGVRLVDEQQKVVGEEVEQRVGGLSRLAARQGPAVVLDSRTEANFAQQLHVVARAGPQSLRLEQLSVAAKILQALVELSLDLSECSLDAILREDEVLGRVNIDVLHPAGFLAGERIDDRQSVDPVAPQFDAVGELFVSGPAFDHVAADAELAA